MEFVSIVLAVLFYLFVVYFFFLFSDAYLYLVIPFATVTVQMFLIMALIQDFLI